MELSHQTVNADWSGSILCICIRTIMHCMHNLHMAEHPLSQRLTTILFIILGAETDRHSLRDACGFYSNAQWSRSAGTSVQYTVTKYVFYSCYHFKHIESLYAVCMKCSLWTFFYIDFSPAYLLNVVFFVVCAAWSFWKWS